MSQRYYLENQIYFVTTKTHQGFEYFKEEIFCDLLVDNLSICKKLKQFDLYAFCILFEHLHLMLKPLGKYNISQIIKSLKENVSCDINRVMNTKVTETPASRLQWIYKNKGIDLYSYRKKFQKKYNKNQIVIPKFKWNKSFYDHIIRNEKDFHNHYNYTAYNFQKHNLPKNWKYTSFNFPDLLDNFSF